MPLDTKRAMLDAVRTSPIIVGAYTDRSGGICPMLAAHRNGGRTSFASFARAWDKYTRAGKTPRRASERELRTLTTMLEASISIDDWKGRELLQEAIVDHRRAQADRALREEHEAVEVDLTELARSLAKYDPPAEPEAERHERREPAHA